MSATLDPVAAIAPDGAATDDPPAAAGRDTTGLVVGAIVAVVATALSMVRYANWWSGGLDLGVFDQGVWLMSRGLAPEVTINGRNLFADHLSPVLFLFVPLYRLWASPFWLFIGQGIALGATVRPLRALARHEGAPEWAATVAAACAAPLWAAALFDFHPATLAVPFIAHCLLEARRGNERRAIGFALCIVLCRAELAWVLVGVAIVAAPHLRRRLLALAPIGMAAGFLIPSLLGAHGTFAVHYGHLGANPKDALTHPWRLASAVFSIDTLTKVVIWLLPVGFLTARRPRWLVATLVASLPMLLSRWPGMSMPWFHYAAPLMPFVIGGAIVALGRDGRIPAPPADGAPEPLARTLARHWCTPQVLAGAAVLSLVLMGPLSPSAPRSLSLWHVLRPEPGVDFAAAIASVGPDDHVAASNRVIDHLTHREDAWLWPAPFAAGDPPELSAAPDAAAAARIDTVILSAKDLDAWNQVHDPAALTNPRRPADEPAVKGAAKVNGTVERHPGTVTIHVR